MKNNPKKNFEHPFEPFFKSYFIEDPLVLVLSYVIVVGSRSTNLNEFFYFHLFFINARLNVLPKDAITDTMDWEIQFLINSFVIRKQLHKSFIYLTRSIQLLTNKNKARILFLIGSFLIERYSGFKLEDEEKLAQNAKYTMEEIFKVLYDQIEVISDRFEELALLRFTD